MYKVVKAHEVLWHQPDDNSPGALSKIMLDPECSDSKHLNFRVACYAPGSSAEPHRHDSAENIFYVLQGRGIAVLDHDRILIEPGTLLFIPPKMEHSVCNTGDENLVMIFVASPPAL